MNKLLLIICLFTSIANTQAREYLITDFGACTDSTQLNTTFIQQTIDKASTEGGGIIVIPKGVFLSGALFFKPNTSLRLEAGAVLKGSDNIADYPLIPSRMEGQNLDYYAALINADNANNFSITGPGTINGNGLKFWKEFWAHREEMKRIGKSSTNLEVHRPRLLFIRGCNNVVIRNATLCNSGFWTTHLYQCNNVLIENCTIRAPFKPVPAPSSDGVDIDVCKKVIVRGCYISVNDDGVCIKGGKGPNARNLPENGAVEDILVENCTFGDTHGTLTIGSESLWARNITVRNCKMNNNCPILRIKMRPDTYQTFENVKISNITGKCGNIIEMRPWKQFFNMEGRTEKPYGIVRNIILDNINVSCKSFGIIEGNPTDQVSNIIFKNITATAEVPELTTKYQNIKAVNVTVNGKPLIIK
ncbi:MAG: exopolygalacturonase [Bacteroidetes bacterium]|jgi:polygalacturonase|nr:exopolygalacturonase [Bacteroidota bacterium]